MMFIPKCEMQIYCLTSETYIHTPELLLHVQLLSGEASAFLLYGFDDLFPIHQFTVHSSCSLLFLPEGVTEDAGALLIIVKLSQDQLQAVLVKFIHQHLVPLGLEKREVGEPVERSH